MHPMGRWTFETHSMALQWSMSFVSTYISERLQVQTEGSGSCGAPIGIPAVSVIFGSGMWNGMLLYEAQILDAYLFAHSSPFGDP